MASARLARLLPWSRSLPDYECSKLNFFHGNLWLGETSWKPTTRTFSHPKTGPIESQRKSWTTSGLRSEGVWGSVCNDKLGFLRGARGTADRALGVPRTARLRGDSRLCFLRVLGGPRTADCACLDFADRRLRFLRGTADRVFCRVPRTAVTKAQTSGNLEN